MQQPKHISEYTKKTVCFYMFVDEETESYLRNSSRLDSNKRSGLWRVVVVRNLPYEDARRTGKVIWRARSLVKLSLCFPNPRMQGEKDLKREIAFQKMSLVGIMKSGIFRFAILLQ